jgi:DNA-binding Lrp family transcriptional regulator
MIRWNKSSWKGKQGNMKREKVTMKDIAKELNLSLATVSYVLNHSEKEKISHDTRFKVLETAKRLGYVPNQTAKSLAKSRSNLIGIIVNLSKTASSYCKQQSMDLACELQQQIYQAGYDTILSVTHEFDEIQINYKHTLEAAFIIDIDEKALKKITKHYYVPLVFLDCDFTEALFYKVLPDYDFLIERGKKILETEQPYLVMDQILNERLMHHITAQFRPEDVFIYKSGANLKEFLSHRVSRKGIIIGELLGMLVERYVDNSNIIVLTSGCANDLLLQDTKRIIVSNRQKAGVAVEIIKKLITLDYDEEANTRILLLPDSPAELSLVK